MIVGRIAVDMLPMSLGISEAHQILASRDTRLGEEDGSDRESLGDRRWRSLGVDVGAAFVGALFLAINIAPTDEVQMLAAEVPVLYSR